jgi:hypothetical protein
MKSSGTGGARLAGAAGCHGPRFPAVLPRLLGGIAFLLCPVLAAAAGTPRTSSAERESRSPEACRLLTAADIRDVQAGRLLEAKASARRAGGFAISECFFRLDPFSSSISLEVTRRGGAESGAQDPGKRWARMFHGETEAEEEDESEARKGGEEIEKEKTPPQPMAGVGDEAYWIGNPASGALYVLRGNAYIRISIGGGDSEDVKRKKAAELAGKAIRRL